VDGLHANAACQPAEDLTLPIIPFSLALKPGVSTQSTALQTGAGVNMSNLIRHKMGQIQKLGGCVTFLDHRNEPIGAREPVGDYGRNLERWCDVIVALAARTAAQIVFERGRRAHRLDRRGNGLLGQNGAAEMVSCSSSSSKVCGNPRDSDSSRRLGIFWTSDASRGMRPSCIGDVIFPLCGQPSHPFGLIFSKCAQVVGPNSFDRSKRACVSSWE
jgi:hypothetical protein